MRLYCDLVSQQFTIQSGINSPISEIKLKRSPLATVEVQFTRDGHVVELGTGASGLFEVKKTGEYDSEPLTASLAFVKTGTGIDTVYTFTLVLINDPLDAQLGINQFVNFTTTFATDLINHTAHGLVANNVIQVKTSGVLPAGLLANTDYHVLATGLTADAFKVALTNNGTPIDITDNGTPTHSYARVDNDIVFATMMAAMKWTDDGKSNETQTVDFKLYNDICRDGDVPPSTPPLLYGVFLDDISTLADFKAVPTVGLQLDYLVEILVTVSGQLSWLTYRLVTGPTTDVEPGQVEPDDYNVSTNDVHWEGAVGPSGPSGRSVGMRYEWNTDTTTSDPTSGKIKVDAASPYSAVTKFRISETDQDGNGLVGLLATWDDSTSAIKGTIYIQDPATPANFLVLSVTARADSGAWDTFDATLINAGGTLTNGLDLVVFFVPNGDKGDTGREGGLKYQFNSTASAGDPTTGHIRFNAAFASATTVSIATTDGDSNALSTLLATLDDSTAVHRSVIIAQKANGTGYFAFYITGALTNNGTYYTFPITPISTGGSIANNDTLYLRATIVGDPGADGSTGGFEYVFNNTAGGTPNSGEITFSNVSTFTSITSIQIHQWENQGGNDIGGFLQTLDDSASSRRCLIVGKNATASIYFAFFLNGPITGTGPYTLPVTPISGGMIPSNAEILTIEFVPLQIGKDAGLNYLWNTSTGSGGPGTGKLNINGGSTTLYISRTTNDAQGIGAYTDTWDDSTSAIKGLLLVQDLSTPANFSIFSITGAVTNVGPNVYDSIPIALVVSGGTLINNSSVQVIFLRTGDAGATGATGTPGGISYKFNTATSGDPTTGKLLLSSGTLSAVTSMNIYETDDDGNSIAALLATFDDGTSTIRGRIEIRDPSTPTKFAIYDITGTLSDAGNYDTLTLSHVASGTIFSSNAQVRVFFTPKGDKGDTGSAGADGSAAAANAFAIDFDGTDDVISFGAAVLNPNSNFTFEAWVKLDVVNGVDQAIFSAYTSGTDYWMLISRDNGGSRPGLCFQYQISATAVFINDPPGFLFTANTWTHIALTRSGNTWQWYINGVATGSAVTDTVATLNTSTNQYLAMLNNVLLMNGKLDDVRVWTVARTAPQLLANMSKELVGNETNLTHYYKFSEGVGTSVEDIPGSANGTLQNGPLWTTGVPFGTGGIPMRLIFPTPASSAAAGSPGDYSIDSGGELYLYNPIDSQWYKSTATFATF